MNKVAIWGAGVVGNNIRKYIRERIPELDVLVFVDKYKLENEDKTVVFNPDILPYLYRSEKIMGVVIGVPGRYREEVKQELQTMGIPEIECEEFKYHTAAYFADNTVVNKGISIYRLSDVRLRVDDKNGLIWMIKNGYKLEESFNYPFQIAAVQMCGGSKKDTYEYIDDEVCSLYQLWAGKNYWHFWHEVVNKIIILEEIGFKGKYILREQSYAREIIDLLGIVKERIIWISEKDEGRSLIVRHLICPEALYGETGRTEEILCRRTERIVNDIEISSFDGPKRIYVKRIGYRKLLGIEEWAEKNGFFVVIPEKYTVEDQIRLFNYADIVLSPHGANSTNVLFMRPGTHFIETFPNEYVNDCNIQTINFKGIHYHMIVSREKRCNEQMDYIINERILDNILGQCI